MSRPDRTYIVGGKRLSLPHILDDEQRTPEYPRTFFPRTDSELDFSQSFFCNAYGIDHGLEFLRFERKCAVWALQGARQSDVLFNDASSQRDRHHWNCNAGCVVG